MTLKIIIVLIVVGFYMLLTTYLLIVVFRILVKVTHVLHDVLKEVKRTHRTKGRF